MPSVGYHKRLYVTDGALNVSPSVDVKEIIANNAIDLLQSLAGPAGSHLITDQGAGVGEASPNPRAPRL